MKLLQDDRIKMDLNVTEWEGVKWINVTRDRIQSIDFVHAVVNCARHRAVKLMTK
jgi:hypothetical protein